MCGGVLRSKRNQNAVPILPVGTARRHDSEIRCAERGSDPDTEIWICPQYAPHFHMLYMNGVYDANGYFWPVKPPTREELDVITHIIAIRIARYLEKAGYLIRDPERDYLDLMPDEDDAMNAIVGASVTIASRSVRTRVGRR